MSTPIKVLLAEDHVLVRKGIYSLLSEHADIEIVAEASNGFEAIAAVNDHQPDVVVMDIKMPELNGLEASRQLRKLHPNLKILALTMYTNEEYVRQMLSSGVSGYVVKQSIPDELINAIRAVYSGNAFLSPSISRNIIDEYLSNTSEQTQTDGYDRLTDREREVLQLLVEGHAPREIAEKLVISPKTVGVHRTNLMEKLGADSLPALVKYAIRKGIISLD